MPILSFQPRKSITTKLVAVQIAFLLYDGFTALDAVGPYDVLSRLPGAEVVFCAARSGDHRTDNGMLGMNADATLAEVGAPEMVVVPGGFGTRRLATDESAEVAWLRQVHPGTTYTTSVCTGALLLGAAGILDGLRATTHWLERETLRTFGAEPVPDRVVVEGKIWTAAGVSAGIDMALRLVAAMHGPELAQGIQLGIEYDPQPPYDTGSPEKAGEPLTGLVRAAMEAENAAAAEALGDA